MKPEKLDAEIAVSEFEVRIRGLNEIDYGDFMREANFYLSRLEGLLAHLGPRVRRKVDEMRLYTQYAPNWEVESTRTRLLKDIRALRRRLTLESLRHPHRGRSAQDWSGAHSNHRPKETSRDLRPH